RFHRHPPGRGNRLLRLHRLRCDFDGGRGDDQSAAQSADRHSRRPRHLHADLRGRRRGTDRHGAVQGAGRCRPARARAPARRRQRELAGFSAVSWFVALGAAVSMSAVLLVFQYGQPRIFFAMARDGLLPRWAAFVNPRTKIPSTTTIITGVFVALWALIGDAAETYDLTNIGTLFAFMLVSIGALVLRYKGPDRPRPFSVPFA